MTVPGSYGSPTFSAPAIWARPATTWSYTLRCTIARVGAVQIWPEWNVHVEAIILMAFGTAASSKTSAAPLPPSSSSSRFMVRPPTSPMRTPTPVEPVNDTMSMSFVSTSASPVSGVEPVTTFTTPGGNPTSCMIRMSSMTPSGFCDAGRTTTVFPMASAGPSLPAMFTIGKLYGVMHATAPTGCRRAMAPMRPPGASAVCGISIGGSGITGDSSAYRAYASNRTAACGTCICLPTSRGTTGLGDDEREQVVEVRSDRVARLLQELGPVLG